LANTLSESGLHSEAAVLHQEIIDDRVRVLGSDHPRTELSRVRLETVNQSVRQS
jgi:hypothetical protein